MDPTMRIQGREGLCKCKNDTIFASTPATVHKKIWQRISLFLSQDPPQLRNKNDRIPHVIRSRVNGEKMWTKWGLNPRPHATELPSQEIAKQARYHCAIRPFHNVSFQEIRACNLGTEGIVEDCRLRKIRASNTPARLQVWAASRRVGCSLLTLCRPGLCHFSR
jgi:hypothetical protein